MNKIRYILPTILATITGKPRYSPRLEWSSNLWVPNVFRAHEYLFGRKFGIRAETVSGKYLNEDTNKWFEFQTGISFEGKCAVLEFHTRKLLSNLVSFNFKLPYLIKIPNEFLQTSNGLSLPLSPFSFPYRFAIAYDALGESTTGFGASPITWTHVTSGSDRVLFIASAMPDSGAWSMTATYNSVSVPKINHVSVSNSTTDWYITLFGVVAPTSGSNTCSVTSSNTLGGCSTSYTGVKQTGLPDSQAANNSGGSNVTSLDSTTNVVDTGCWLVLASRSMTGIVAAGTSTTLRGYGFMPTNKYFAIMDSNGTVGTGNQTLQATVSSAKMGGVIASFAPAGGGGGATYRRKALLGVGQ